MYTYSEIDDNGYAIDGTLIFRQPVLCSYYDNSSSSHGPHLHQSCDTIDMNIASGDTVFTYTDTSNTSKSITDYYSVKYNTTVMTNESGTYTFILKWDDSCRFTFNGSQRIDLTSSVERDEVSQNFTVDLMTNTYYPAFVEFEKYTGDSKLQLYWIRPGRGTEEIVPQQNLWFDHYYGGNRIEFDVTCPTKYAKRSLQSNQSNNAVWGDGHRIDGEKWDDSNTQDGDGCNSIWEVEKGYICIGGNSTSTDKWVKCPVGYKSFRDFESTDYVKCIPDTGTYNGVFYITIVVFVIGMVILLVYNFALFLNEIGKKKKSELLKKKYSLKNQNDLSRNEKESIQVKPERQGDQNGDGLANSEFQNRNKSQNRTERQCDQNKSNSINITIRCDEESKNETNSEESKNETNLEESKNETNSEESKNETNSEESKNDTNREESKNDTNREENKNETNGEGLQSSNGGQNCNAINKDVEENGENNQDINHIECHK